MARFGIKTFNIQPRRPVVLGPQPGAGAVGRAVQGLGGAVSRLEGGILKARKTKTLFQAETDILELNRQRISDGTKSVDSEEMAEFFKTQTETDKTNILEKYSGDREDVKVIFERLNVKRQQLQERAVLSRFNDESKTSLLSKLEEIRGVAAEEAVTRGDMNLLKADSDSAIQQMVDALVISNVAGKELSTENRQQIDRANALGIIRNNPLDAEAWITDTANTPDMEPVERERLALRARAAGNQFTNEGKGALVRDIRGLSDLYLNPESMNNSPSQDFKILGLWEQKIDLAVKEGVFTAEQGETHKKILKDANRFKTVLGLMKFQAPQEIQQNIESIKTPQWEAGISGERNENSLKRAANESFAKVIKWRQDDPADYVTVTNGRELESLPIPERADRILAKEASIGIPAHRQRILTNQQGGELTEAYNSGSGETYLSTITNIRNSFGDHADRAIRELVENNGAPKSILFAEDVTAATRAQLKQIDEIRASKGERKIAPEFKGAERTDALTGSEDFFNRQWKPTFPPGGQNDMSIRRNYYTDMSLLNRSGGFVTDPDGKASNDLFAGQKIIKNTLRVPEKFTDITRNIEVLGGLKVHQTAQDMQSLIIPADLSPSEYAEFIRNEGEWIINEAENGAELYVRGVAVVRNDRSQVGYKFSESAALTEEALRVLPGFPDAAKRLGVE